MGTDTERRRDGTPYNIATVHIRMGDPSRRNSRRVCIPTEGIPAEVVLVSLGGLAAALFGLSVGLASGYLDGFLHGSRGRDEERDLMGEAALFIARDLAARMITTGQDPAAHALAERLAEAAGRETLTDVRQVLPIDSKRWGDVIKGRTISEDEEFCQLCGDHFEPKSAVVWDELTNDYTSARRALGSSSPPQ